MIPSLEFGFRWSSGSAGVAENLIHGRESLGVTWKADGASRHFDGATVFLAHQRVERFRMNAGAWIPVGRLSRADGIVTKL